MRSKTILGSSFPMKSRYNNAYCAGQCTIVLCVTLINLSAYRAEYTHSKGSKSLNRSIMLFHIQAFTMKDVVFTFQSFKRDLSEVGCEPTPGEPDCDLNAAP